MTNKIVLFHLNQVGYGGTEKAILSFIDQMETMRALKSCSFLPYLFFHDTRGDFKSWRIRLTDPTRYKKKYVDAYSREPEFLKRLGSDRVFSGTESDFYQLLSRLQPSILHFNRGEPDDYYTQKIERIPKGSLVFETNIFGRSSNQTYLERLEKIFFVSQWLKNKSTWASEPQGAVLYNPIEACIHSKSFREEQNIPQDAYVIGMMGRPDLKTDDFIQNAIEPILENQIHGKKLSKEVYLLCLGLRPPLKNSRSSKVRYLPASTQADSISKFYNSIDVLAHRRIDGETFGMIIAEAMMNGKPVVSHISPVDNAQLEVIDNPNCISDFADFKRYQDILLALLENPLLYKEESHRVQSRARALFQPQHLTRELLRYYDDALNSSESRK